MTTGSGRNGKPAGLRMFFALPVDETAREAMAPVHALLRERSSGITIVRPENYHLTLKFLGGVDEQVARNLSGGMGAMRGDRGPLDCELARLGAFPDMRRPAVLWAGIRAPESLGALFDEIEKLAEGNGFPRERRPFRPHLTLARVRRGGSPDRAIADYFAKNGGKHFGNCRFARLVLFSSDLTPGGPVYREVYAREL